MIEFLQFPDMEQVGGALNCVEQQRFSQTAAVEHWTVRHKMGCDTILYLRLRGLAF